MRDRLDRLLGEMILHNAGDPRRVQHLVKVHEFARYIGRQEGLSQEELETLEAAAYVHDIGIRPAERKYGYSNGRLQEELGPPEAERMLRGLDFPEEMIRRVAFLVGCHHSYRNIQGLDWQILVEADLLVNLYEKEAGAGDMEHAMKCIFRTAAGREVLQTMFDLKEAGFPQSEPGGEEMIGGESGKDGQTAGV